MLAVAACERGNEETTMSSAARHRSHRPLAERVFDLLDIADFRPAVTEEERDAIFRLRYDAYLREGAIEPNGTGRLRDRFDDLDNVWIFGVYVHGELAACIRLHATAEGHPELPATGVFDDYLRDYIDQGKIVVDPTRHAIDHEMSRAHPELVYLTTRIGWMSGDYFGADGILATVRREHQAFYERTFGHQLICPPRPYYALKKPLNLMLLDFRATREHVLERFPFYRSTNFERRSLFGAPGLPKGWSQLDRAPVSNTPVVDAPTLVADNTRAYSD